MKINICDLSHFIDSLGSHTERLCMEIDEHDVQILRFDGDNDNVYVYVDSHAAMLPADSVLNYIIERVSCL